jgi:hypothetical protein
MDTPFLSPCEFQLVLVYNPEPGEVVGREIEPEVLAEIFTELNKRFGNWTPLAGTGDHGGVWSGHAEPSIRIEVSVLPERVKDVRRYVIEIGKLLGQEAMYFKVGPPCVEIIDIKKVTGKAVEGSK